MKPKVLIVVEGGVIQSIHSNVTLQEIEIEVHDIDNLKEEGKDTDANMDGLDFQLY
jgi:hypothetical protein